MPHVMDLPHVVEYEREDGSLDVTEAMPYEDAAAFAITVLLADRHAEVIVDDGGPFAVDSSWLADSIAAPPCL